MENSKSIDEIIHEAEEYTARLTGPYEQPFGGQEAPYDPKFEKAKELAAASSNQARIPENFAEKPKDLLKTRPQIPYVTPPPYTQPHGPCPCCGYCPTCGRGNRPYPEPYRIWYGDSTGGPFRT